MNENFYCLGIDTSNYTTSAAIVDQNYQMIAEHREMLPVKLGERGLRQSQALFEHIDNIVKVIDQITKQIDCSRIKIVSVSERPRPIEGSYMPVFKSGQSYGKIVAKVLKANYLGFSHQEGHIEAVKHYSSLKDTKEFLALHLSGGTTEVLSCTITDMGYRIEILGGTKDIALGQLIDRTGVSMGLLFPCGKEMDKLAFHYLYDESKTLLDPKLQSCAKRLQKISVLGNELNLSGIETQVQRLINTHPEIAKEEIAGALFLRIGEALGTLITNASKETGLYDVIMAGGVSASTCLRMILQERYMQDININLEFGKSEYSTDNAIGIALLGMRRSLL